MDTIVSNDISDMVAMRHEMHRHPEIGLSEVWTSDFVAGHLEAMGYDVHRGLARTGVVATLRNGSSTRSVRGLAWESVPSGELAAASRSVREESPHSDSSNFGTEE